MRRKGQEEVVGFVAIIVIISLVLVFFLGITLRNDEPQVIGSVSVKQFLDSTAQYTSSCDLGLREKYADLQQLMESCHKNSQTRCLNGTFVCTEYTNTMSALLEKSWPTGENRAIKGYIFNVTYETTGRTEEITSFQNGSCGGNFMSEERLSPDAFAGGTYVNTLQICL